VKNVKQSLTFCDYYLMTAYTDSWASCLSCWWISLFTRKSGSNKKRKTNKQT